ncbi:hypothetical protein MC885_016116 [Smutsia gigantea]|nr:hypothetical protein MC885_016116 [Smutsia gigantea]
MKKASSLHFLCSTSWSISSWSSCFPLAP